jgi:putative transposase
MQERRPSRLSTFDYVGCHRYLLTMCTLRRRPLFSRADLVVAARSQLLRTAQDCGFKILAFVFMPDHLHVCVESTHLDADLRKFCYCLRRRVSCACWKFIRGPLWQNGFHERILRDGEDVRMVISYILMNPVRARLVERYEDYAHSWSVSIAD